MSEGNNVEGSWGRTDVVFDRLRNDPLFEEFPGEVREGIFDGRRIITRDAPINGGIYLGSNPREGIIVDDEKYPKELREAYRELTDWFFSARFRADIKNGGIEVHQKVLEIAKSKLGGNTHFRELERRISEEVTKAKDDEWVKNGIVINGDVKMPLNEFMRKQIGVCRHRALLAGYLLETMVSQGNLFGKVSIDRNTIPSRGGHAWVRFDDGDNIIIIDPSLGYVGRIEDAPIDRWDYRRPEDPSENFGTVTDIDLPTLHGDWKKAS